MPKRTNEFQQLVTLIHKAIAPGAKITESAMVKAPHFGDLREIDVLLESDIGPYRMKVAIEAKDHKRKLNVTEIETIIGKYRASGSLIVDRVVLVSRHGFSNQASEKAKLNGITLLTLAEAKSADWSFFLPANCQGGAHRHNLRLDIKPHVANLELKPLGKKALSQLDISRGLILCRCHRNSFGSPAKYANHVLKCHLLRNPSFCTQFNDALKKQQKACVRIGWPMAPYILSLDGVEIELAVLNFHVHATYATGPIDFKSYELQGDETETQMIRHATADVAGQRVQFLFQGSNASKKLFIQFGKCPQE